MTLFDTFGARPTAVASTKTADGGILIYPYFPRWLRIALLAGASVVALVAATPSAGAADLSKPTLTKAQPPAPAPQREVGLVDRGRSV